MNHRQSEMRLCRLECTGLTLGDYVLPPFRLWAGEALCLHVVLPSPSWQETLVPLLTAQVPHPALRFHGSVGYLERPMPRRRWWGALHNPSAREWLVDQKGAAPEDAAAILERVGLSSHVPIGQVGWNERTLLAVEVCLLRPAELVVFDTVGNDPLGVRRVLERLTSRPAEVSLIYLKTRQETDAPCLPGSTCLSFAPRPLQATIVE